MQHLEEHGFQIMYRTGWVDSSKQRKNQYRRMQSLIVRCLDRMETYSNGMSDAAKEMQERITSSGSYSEALCIIGEYVNITSEEEMDEGMDMTM